MTAPVIALFGATGFVGSAVLSELERRGAEVRVIPTPRLSSSTREVADLVEEAQRHPSLAELIRELDGVDCVVNAAGFPDASSLDEDLLFGANALLPRVLLEAAAASGVRRLVHVSSAVVQNDKSVLDESETLLPFSPYSTSKVRGEQVLQVAAAGNTTVVRYRPPSVHAPGRRVTRMVARIARSPMATVARPATSPTPQAQLVNVGAAVAHLAVCHADPPPVVMHPSEGVTVASLMTDLSGGGREPFVLPRWFCLTLVRIAKLVGRLHRPTAANARRVELLWLGQQQGSSWLASNGWTPVVGPEGWRALGRSATEERTAS